MIGNIIAGAIIVVVIGLALFHIKKGNKCHDCKGCAVEHNCSKKK